MRFHAVWSVPLFFPLQHDNFVFGWVECDRGLTALGLVPGTGLHGLSFAWSQTSWTGLTILYLIGIHLNSQSGSTRVIVIQPVVF